MKVWIDSVKDRTLEDVKRAKELIMKDFTSMSEEERTEYLNGLKGTINKADIDRVLNNISFLDEVLELNLTIPTIAGIPTKADIDLLLSDTEQIRSASSVYNSTPLTPVQPLNTIFKWNDLETILDDVYNLILNNLHYYCGSEIVAGENIGYIL